MSGIETPVNETDAQLHDPKSDDLPDEPPEWAELSQEEYDEMKADYDLWNSITVPVDVEITEEMWATAQARRERYDVDDYDLTPLLMDYVMLEMRFLINGEEIHRTPAYGDETPG